MNQLKIALRQLLKNPGFTTVAALTIALGIGANSAIFSVVDAVLLRPLPYPGSDRLVWLSEQHPKFPVMAISYPDFTDWQKQQSVFEQLGVYTWANYNLTGSGEPLRLRSARVSASALAALRVQPISGRLFREDDDKPGAAPVLLISESLWRDRFGRRADILQQPVTLDGQPWTIVGIMPFTFSFPSPVDIWVPVGQAASEPGYQSRGNHPGLLGVARLKPALSLEQARAEMAAIAKRLEQLYPESNRNVGIRIDPLIDNRVGSNVRVALWTILGAVGMVLLIACGNVANLLLARAAARQKEIAVRTAIGATRWHIIRQLLTESTLLAILGGALGVGVAYCALTLVLVIGGDSLPRADEIHLDLRVLAFTGVVSLLTGLGFGLAPAWQASRTDLQGALKAASRHATAAQGRVRQVLVIGEVAVSLLLLVGAGLMLRTFYALRTVDSGFNFDNVLSFRLDLPARKYASTEQQIQFYQQLTERLAALPGVAHVGAAYQFPLAHEGWQTAYTVEGEPEPPAGQRPQMELTPVSPDYFTALGIRLLRGRFFTDADDRSHLRDRDLSGLNEQQRWGAGLNAIIIDEEFARRHWPNGNPIGQGVRLGGGPNDPRMVVVGVVRRVKMDELGEQGGFVQGYVPLWQTGGAGRAVVIKTTVAPTAMIQAVRELVHALDPDQPLYDVRTLADVRARSLSPQRLNLTVLGVFAGLAVSLASLGLYGVLAYLVTQRHREIGIRMALGAKPLHVLALVLRDGAKLTFIGLLLGIAGALALTRVMARLLYEVRPTDPLTFLLVSLALMAVALVACALPARRAAKVDPLEALRET